MQRALAISDRCALFAMPREGLLQSRWYALGLLRSSSFSPFLDLGSGLSALDVTHQEAGKKATAIIMIESARRAHESREPTKGRNEDAAPCQNRGICATGPQGLWAAGICHWPDGALGGP